MKNLTIIALFVVLFGFSRPLSSFAAESHTEAQEQQEKAQSATSSEKYSQTHEQIEAAEKAALGEEAYQKLEVGHKFEEANPAVFWSVVSGVIFLIIAAVFYAVRKRKNRA